MAEPELNLKGEQWLDIQIEDAEDGGFNLNFGYDEQRLFDRLMTEQERRVEVQKVREAQLDAARDAAEVKKALRDAAIIAEMNAERQLRDAVRPATPKQERKFRQQAAALRKARKPKPAPDRLQMLRKRAGP